MEVPWRFQYTVNVALIPTIYPSNQILELSEIKSKVIDCNGWSHQDWIASIESKLTQQETAMIFVHQLLAFCVPCLMFLASVLLYCLLRSNLECPCWHLSSCLKTASTAELTNKQRKPSIFRKWRKAGTEEVLNTIFWSEFQPYKFKTK